MTHADPFLAISDPTRRTILQRLRSGPLSVGRIAEGLPVSRPAVSQHLKVLKDARLVTYRSKGTANIYALDKDGFVAVLTWIDDMWAGGPEGLFTDTVG